MRGLWVGLAVALPIDAALAYGGWRLAQWLWGIRRSD